MASSSSAGIRTATEFATGLVAGSVTELVTELVTEYASGLVSDWELMVKLTRNPGEPIPGSVRFLLAAGVAQFFLLMAAALWPGRGFPWPGLPIMAGAFAVYAFASARTGRPSSSPEDARNELRVIWGWAILFRLALLPLAPELTDDFYRYLWDGHVQLQGINPYLYAPADPALEALRTPWHGLINNPTVSTVYPPLAQAVFLLNALLGGTLLGLKILWVSLDLCTAFFLGRVAERSGRDPRGVLTLYLWSPLLIIETAWNGHLEPLGLVYLGLLLYVGARRWSSGLALALATLAKFAPVAALPPLWRRYGWRSVVAFGVTMALFYLPYVGAGDMLWAGLGTFAEHWRFQEGAFAVLEWVIPGALAPRVASGVIVLAVIGWTVWKSYDLERALFWILGAGLLLSPTVHPWYVLWALPFAALRRSRGWILLTGLAVLGYWGLESFHTQGIWPQPLWARLMLWVPVFALIGLDAVRGRSGLRG